MQCVQHAGKYDCERNYESRRIVRSPSTTGFIMKNIYLFSQERISPSSLWTFIDGLNPPEPGYLLGIHEVDPKQEDSLVFSRRGNINVTRENTFRLSFFSYLLSEKPVAGEKVIKIILIRDADTMDEAFWQFFTKNVKAFNKKKIYLLFCGTSIPARDLIRREFEVISR